MDQLTIQLKRGYSVKVIPDSEAYRGGQIVILGNYSKSNYMGTAIVSKYGIAPTIRENHGQVTGILVNEHNDKRRRRD